MRSRATAWPLRFVLLAIAWGSTFLFIKIGDEALAPLQVSLGRIVVGAATLLAILGLRGERLPTGAHVWGLLAVGAILLNVAPVTLTLLFTHAPHGVAAKQVLSVLALGVFGTGLTFVLNYSLIRDIGATVTSTVAYVMPIVSTLRGIVALGEPLRWYQPVGAAIIVVGAALARSPSRTGPQAVTVSPRSAKTSRSETLLPAKAARSSGEPWVK